MSEPAMQRGSRVHMLILIIDRAETAKNRDTYYQSDDHETEKTARCEKPRTAHQIGDP